MQRISPINPEQVTGATKECLDNLQKNIGMVPNIFNTMAQSPAALNSLLAMKNALSEGVLDAKLQEQIALYVGELHGCTYCLAAHTLMAKGQGLTDEDIVAARKGTASDEKNAQALVFVKQLVSNRAKVSDEEVNQLKKAGFSDAELSEIIAHVCVNIFTNYFNHVANTDIDFPKVEPLVS